MGAELNAPENRLLYLYGITESPPQDFPELIGVDLHTKVVPLQCDEVVCWVSRVSADAFGENLARNMENLEWLAEAGVAHQRVIAAIAQESEILPARFGTVFRTEASLRKHVRGRARELKRDFERVKDAEEWGVKVFALEPAVRLPEVRSGRDYLKAKAALLPKRRPRSDTSNQIAEFEQALRRVSAETAAIGIVSGGQRGLTFQTSLLVKRANRKKFESVLKRFSDSWAAARRIECTGPWPPYSFVSREHEGARSK